MNASIHDSMSDPFTAVFGPRRGRLAAADTEDEDVDTGTRDATEVARQRPMADKLPYVGEDQQLRNEGKPGLFS